MSEFFTALPNVFGSTRTQPNVALWVMPLLSDLGFQSLFKVPAHEHPKKTYLECSLSRFILRIYIEYLFTMAEIIGAIQ